MGWSTPAPGSELRSIGPRQHGASCGRHDSHSQSLAGNNKTPTLPLPISLPLSHDTVSDPRGAKVGQSDNVNDRDSAA